jgi:hypothetical protein
MVAGSGYGSEENYDFMEANGIEPFVKFPVFHQEQEKAFKNKAFLAQNMFYNAGKDFLVCPVGQRMEKAGESTRKPDGGYVSPVSYYEAQNCTDCPLKGLCHSAEGNRRIETNHSLNRHKERVRELLASPEGRMHRRKRSIEPEAMFGQVKSNKQYNRFRHFNCDSGKVMMDFAILAIAFNIGKLYNKRKNTPGNGQKAAALSKMSIFIVCFIPLSRKHPRRELFYSENLRFAA